jgi:hypothetical protein
MIRERFYCVGTGTRPNEDTSKHHASDGCPNIEPYAVGLRPILEISQPGRLHEIAVFTARSASGAVAMPVIGVVRGAMQVAPATVRTVDSPLNRRFRFRRIASTRGIRA